MQNVNLADDEAVKASKERKRKAKAVYTGYDDDEFDEGAVGKKKDVLGKYDDDDNIGRSEVCQDRFSVSGPEGVSGLLTILV